MSRAKIAALAAAACLVCVLAYWDEIPTGALASADKKVFVRASIDREACSAAPRAPILVTIVNRSDKTVRELEFDIEVYQRGDSRNLAAIAQEPHTRIVGPGETQRFCSTFPLASPYDSPPSDPVVSATLRRATFYGADEPIPK